MRCIVPHEALRLLENPYVAFLAAVVLRVGFLIQGYYQDKYSALKFTDIDYYVFTDAARFVSNGQSPYLRDTYRYTPLLAWLLVPTTWSHQWFIFGKTLFAISDLVTGWLTILVLQSSIKMTKGRAVRYALLWLLNPMVATISTRGSSEGLLAAIVVSLLWAALTHRLLLAGSLVGFAVHFKIYPFIYAISIFWWLGGDAVNTSPSKAISSPQRIRGEALKLLSPSRLKVTASSLFVFIILNGSMLLMLVLMLDPNLVANANCYSDTDSHSWSILISIILRDQITVTIFLPTILHFI